MRNKRRNDSYVAAKVDRILNNIPNNPFIGFSNTIKPIDRTFDEWDESDFTNELYESQQ